LLRGVFVKKAFFGLAAIFALGVFWLVKGNDDGKQAVLETPAVSTAGVSPSLSAQGPDSVYQDKGHFHAVAPEVFEAPTPPGQEVRVGLGDTAPLKFIAPQRPPSGMGVGSHRMTAKAFRGTDKPIELEVNKVEKGFEVPFSPQGPGQFNVVLSEDGTPVGAQLVGVVGAVGVDNALTDPLALDAADPVEYRARTPGRMTSR
jgi:hypothetical protein